MEIANTVLSVVLTSICSYLVWFLQNNKKKTDYQNKALMLMLRQELKTLSKNYIEAGEITQEQYDEFSEIYETYHSLGGNGLATKLFDEIKKLDLKGE